MKIKMKIIARILACIMGIRYKIEVKNIPEFNNMERWVLRSYSKDRLQYFNQNGIDTNNLSLISFL